MVYTFLPPLFVLSLLLTYVFNMSFGLSSSVVVFHFVFDEVALYMLYIACFVVFVSYFFVVHNSVSVSICFVFVVVVCSLVFVTDNLFILYIAYESSLIPILYIIMNWGSYPERSFSSVMLLVYTSFFTFPFIFVIFTLNFVLGTLSFSLIYSFPLTMVLSVVVFFTFAVKLPIYGLHFWLPIAHVEAPTFGSIILAGVLLKLGGVGIVRFFCVINIPILSGYIISYFFVFIVYITLVCCLQSDFKRLVAYSSVSHIIAVPILIFSSSFIGLKGVILLMFFHGVSSPLIFMFVGLLYSTFSTRQHISMRGLVVFSPLISFFLILTFFFTISTPPFPSFVSEVYLGVVSVYMSFYFIPFLLLFFFLSIVYNLLWLSSSCFSHQCSSYNYEFQISFAYFIPVYISLFVVPIFFSSIFYLIL